MFDKLRESAHGFFGKVLLIMLVVSFGIWGIGDIFRTSSSGSNVVATVGKSPITVQEFGRALRMRQNELQRRFGTAYTPEMLKKMRVDLMVRDELINNHLIENEAESLGIVASDDDVIKTIAKVPDYLDKDGKFDKAAFIAALREHGISEQKYISDVRKTLSSQLLIDIVLSNIEPPAEMVQAIFKAREEQRAADIMVLGAGSVKNVATPTEQEIKSYYDANSKLFLTPEYRDISYIDLKIADIQFRIEIPDNEIKQTYNDKIQDYQVPERRQLEQMLFEKEEYADEAYDKLQHGGSFNEVAKNSHATNKGKTAVGLVGRQGLPADEAAVVFGLKEGEVSKPFKSDFGWHIFRVTKIEPASVTPLADVKKDIAKDLSATKAVDTLTRLTNQVEDDMAGGMSMEEAAKKAGFKVATVKQVSRAGTSPDGKKAAMPDYANFIETAFSYNDKEHSQAVQAPDGSYFIVRVDSITPEHVRPLAEVKDRILSILKEQKTADALKKLATDTAEQLRYGKKPDVTASSFVSGNIKRDSHTTEDKKHPLPPGLVQELFSIKPHDYTHAYEAENGSYLIASLSTIIPAPSMNNEGTMQEISNEVKNMLQRQVMNDYLAYLLTKYRVSLNQAAFTATEDNGQE